MSRIQRLHRLRRSSWREQLIVLKAGLWLVTARLALRLVSFQTLEGWFGRPSRDSVHGAERTAICRRVQWAIAEASDLLPGETVCFPRAMAAQMMLRRRGIQTTLYYGAAKLPTRKLKAHVWLQDGTVGIVGFENAAEYHILAKYP
jgi:hypothetical protein